MFLQFMDAIKLIDELLASEYLGPENYKDTDRAQFEYQSYKRWAAIELRNYILKKCIEKGNPLFDTVEEFRNIMDDYACQANTGTGNFLFAVAYDVTTDLLDRLIVEQYKEV